MKQILTIATAVALALLLLPISLLAATISYEYDALDRLIQVTYPDGTVIEYRYDPAGNRTQRLVSGSPVMTHAITVTIDPPNGGSASCDPNPVTDGETSTCTATPNTGYSFTGWSGACSGMEACVVTVDQALSVTARFGLIDDLPDGVRQLQQAYLTYYGRAADSAGLNFWLDNLAQGQGAAEIRADFGSPNQAEFVAIYGEAVSNDAFFDRAYQNILNRAPDAEGKAYWLETIANLEARNLSQGQEAQTALAHARAEVLQAILNAALLNAEWDADVVNNKVALAALITERTATWSGADQSALINATRALLAEPLIGDPQVFADLQQQVMTLTQSPPSMVASTRSSRPIAEIAPTAEHRSPLTWSELPQGLRELLSAHDAQIREAQYSEAGQVISFATDAALVGHDDNDYSDIYLYEIDNDRLTLISTNAQGHAANAPSTAPRIAADGQTVIYSSTATDLVSGTQNAYRQLYQYELFGTTTRLTVTATGHPGNGDTTSALIAGDWIIYTTQATNLGPEGRGLYRQHRTSGQRELIGLDHWGQPDPQASDPAATADGELIAYQRPDEQGRQHIYLTDTLSVERISHHADATLGLLDHCCVALSHDGQFIAYREQGTQGSDWLHILDRDTEQFTRLPWPEGLDQAPHFHEDGAELWWINPEQGPGQPEILHRVDNPLR